MTEGPSSELGTTFDRTVEEGEHRVGRSWPALIATGTMGGLDVGIGVFGLLVVEHATGQRLLGALAFGIGFLALQLGRSELFTENFLVPIATAVARRARPPAVVRLWGTTLVTNLAGGWVVMAFVMSGFPRLEQTAIESGAVFPAQGIGWRSFAAAVLAGMMITLMTWMERGATSEVARIAAVWGIAFLLAAGPLNHVIVISLEMFAALETGAPFGYADWAGFTAWSGFGNMVGGIGLVTALRLVQVGRAKIESQRTDASPASPG